MAVDGEIDLSTAPQLRARIEEVVHGGARHVVVDLASVGFMDSSGLSVLVAAMKRLREAGGGLAIACPNESILKVFQVTGLDREIPIAATVREAIRR